jgi:SAM-dependent methyltransferase
MYHQFRNGYGPFDVLRCDACGSASTDPMPSSAELEAFYLNYQAFRGDAYLENQRSGMLDLFYDSCMEHLHRQIGCLKSDSFRWFDIGAGNGQMAMQMAKAFPEATGLAVDMPNETPAWDAEMVAFRSIDLNAEDFASCFDGQADVVYSNFVIEHVRQPRDFVCNLLKLVKPGGLLFITSPDFSSFSRRIMGRRWPNIVPGEHLCIPSRIGLKSCIESQAEALRLSGSFNLTIQPITFAYSLRYVLQYFGLKPLAQMFPPAFLVPTPNWAFMMALRRLPTPTRCADGVVAH